jgi:hypothetical protein
MNFISRFFGHRLGDSEVKQPLVANTEIKSPLSLVVLFSEKCPTDQVGLTKSLVDFHPSMNKARFELDSSHEDKSTLLGMLGWANHVVRCVGFNHWMPPAIVERCVLSSSWDSTIKQAALLHKAHAILFYAGYEESPHEQYVALATAAAVLHDHGGLMVVNDAAHTACPTGLLCQSGATKDKIEFLRQLPIPMLYCGFVKYGVEGAPSVWMRTFGASLLGLPDFIVHADGNHQGEHYFQLFSLLMGEMQLSKVHIAAGHTMQIGEGVYFKFRAPMTSEPFDATESNLLVVEPIRSDQIN